MQSSPKKAVSAADFFKSSTAQPRRAPSESDKVATHADDENAILLSLQDHPAPATEEKAPAPEQKAEKQPEKKANPLAAMFERAGDRPKKAPIEKTAETTPTVAAPAPATTAPTKSPVKSAAKSPAKSASKKRRSVISDDESDDGGETVIKEKDAAFDEENETDEDDEAKPFKLKAKVRYLIPVLSHAVAKSSSESSTTR